MKKNVLLVIISVTICSAIWLIVFLTFNKREDNIDYNKNNKVTEPTQHLHTVLDNPGPIKIDSIQMANPRPSYRINENYRRMLTIGGRFSTNTEPGEEFSDRSFKIFQVLDEHVALVNGKDRYGYYDGMIYLLVGDRNSVFYDDKIINVPNGKSARMVGTYQYRTRNGEFKTVPKIKFIDK